MEVVKALIAKDADVNAKDKVCEALARDLEHEDFPASAVDRKSGKAAASGPSVYLYSLPVCSSLPPAPLPLIPFLLSTSSWLPLPPPFFPPLVFDVLVRPCFLRGLIHSAPPFLPPSSARRGGRAVARWKKRRGRPRVTLAAIVLIFARVVAGKVNAAALC